MNALQKIVQDVVEYNNELQRRTQVAEDDTMSLHQHTRHLEEFNRALQKRAQHAEDANLSLLHQLHEKQHVIQV